MDDPIGVRAATVLRDVCPCDACRFRERCNLERLACSAFSMYLAGEPAPRWSAAPRAPTTARFAALLGY